MINRLIFEGADDRHVVMNLLYSHEHDGSRLKDVFDPKDKNGIDNLIGTLREELGATDLGRLAVIIDADTNLSAQWGRVSSILREYGCNDVPPEPVAEGTILSLGNGKHLGIWVMPDNQSNGALEDFVSTLIAAEDTLWPKAQVDVDAIPEVDRRFRTTYLSKAKVHTWLAWQEEPGTKMGETFKKKYLNPEHPRARVFVDWLRRLLMQ